MYQILVKRGDFNRHDELHKMFGHRIPVTWDRRQRERRYGAAEPAVEERRQGERRGPPALTWPALGFVVIDRKS